MKTMNQTEFAAHIGVDKSRVTQLKQTGRLVLTQDGKVKVTASLVKIKETSDPNRDDVTVRHADARGKDSEVDEIGQEKLAKPAKIKKEPKPHDANHVSFSESRAKEQFYKAEQAETEHKERMRKLVAIEEIEHSISDIETTHRQELENLPHRIAAELVAKDINAIRITLKQEIHNSLVNLRRAFEKLAILLHGFFYAINIFGKNKLLMAHVSISYRGDSTDLRIQKAVENHCNELAKEIKQILGAEDIGQ